MINYKRIATFPILVALASCAGNKQTMIADSTAEGQIEEVQRTNDIVPGWFVEQEEKEGSIFSTGTGAAPDIQLSVDIAILNAKTVLADRLNGKLSSMTKNFISKVGQSDRDIGVIEELEKTTRNLIAEIDVSGYKVSKMELKPVGTQFRTFVQLEYNEEIAEKILMQKLRKERNKLSKYRSKEAFEELDEKVEEQRDDELSFEETFKPVNPVTITDL